MEGGWNPYAYVGNDPVNKVDPDGLMEFRNEPMKTVRGTESSYRFKFTPLSDKATKTGVALFSLGKKLNYFQKFSDIISPEPVGPKSSSYNPQNIIDVGLLDAKLEIEYEKIIQKNTVGLNRSEAEDFLNTIFNLYPQYMKKHYDTPQNMLNKADANAKKAWFSIDPPPVTR